MADTLRVTHGEQAEDLDGLAREHNEKLQALGRALVSGLYMLVRSVRMYDPTNRIFDRPLVQLQDVINQIISREGKVELVGIKDAIYLNGMLVKVDAASLDNVRSLLEEMRAKDVTGFTLVRPAHLDELKNFIWIFSKTQTAQSEDDGVEGHKLMAMKVARWSRLKDKIERERGKPKLNIDRKKYALVVYGRAIFFIRKYMESLAADKPINSAQALRIIQDLVDISFENKTHFLGMTTIKDDEYLAFHQVNVCLMAIVFGAELGMTKQQLRDLGYIALFHDAGMCTVPEELLKKTGPYSREEKLVVKRAPLVTVRNILRERVITRATLIRIVTTFEHKADYGVPVRDEKGQIRSVASRSDLGLYARIIAICGTYDALTSKRPFRDAYGPDIALQLMWSEMRHKFDPVLLKVFMKVMAVAPIKVLKTLQQNVSLGV